MKRLDANELPTSCPNSMISIVSNYIPRPAIYRAWLEINRVFMCFPYAEVEQEKTTQSQLNFGAGHHLVQHKSFWHIRIWGPASNFKSHLNQRFWVELQITDVFFFFERLSDIHYSQVFTCTLQLN